jgi:hypothetical protein
MSYNIYAGNEVIHLTWNYNEKIIVPLMGEYGLRGLNGKTCAVAAEAIAELIDDLHQDLRRMHVVSLKNNGPATDGRAVIEEFMNKYGNGGYGHVLEGILRLTEIMVTCYRAPDDIFEIN